MMPQAVRKRSISPLFTTGATHACVSSPPLPYQAITFEEHFSGDPGVYTLETAVMDRIDGKAGAQRTSFTIAPVPRGPSLSDVVLVDKVVLIEEDDQRFDPMLYREGRMVPELSTDLPGDTSSLSLFFLLHPLAGGKSQPALRMQVFCEGQLLAEMPISARIPTSFPKPN